MTTLYLTLFVLLVVWGMTHGQNCYMFQFDCQNGNCVEWERICDGTDDCGNMRDERDEKGFCPKCPFQHYFQCDNGRCIRGSGICNGLDECGDLSDEGGTSGTCPNCPTDYFKCDNGECKPGYVICFSPGRAACSDGSDLDENGICLNCASDYFHCDIGGPIGQCIPHWSICDGRQSCGGGDMSDEKDENGICPGCPSNLFQCANGGCVYADYICNGKNECADSSDERDENGICPRCPSIYWQCDDGRCILGDYRCDGYNDCSDGSDESRCPTHSENWVKPSAVLKARLTHLSKPVNTTKHHKLNK